MDNKGENPDFGKICFWMVIYAQNQFHLKGTEKSRHFSTDEMGVGKKKKNNAHWNFHRLPVKGQHNFFPSKVKIFR